MDYNFKQFNTRGSGFKFCGLTKKDNYIICSKSFVKKIKSYKVNFYFDKSNPAIMIKPTEIEDKICYSINKNTGIVGLTDKTMPNGRYYFEEEFNGGLVCIFNK